MPIVLDPTGAGVQDSNRADMFIRLDLSDKDRSQVIYRKFISNDPMNDFIPQIGKEWIEQTVGLPRTLIDLARKNTNFRQRLFRQSANGDTKILGEDDGLILTFVGTYAGERYVDRGRIVTDDTAEEMMEAGNVIPTFALWQFRLKEVIATDGPNLRDRLMESQDQQAAREREGMFKTMAQAFAQFLPSKEPSTLAEAELQEANVKNVDTVMSDKLQAALDEAEGDK